ncbi:lysine methyltransferase 5Ab [Diretmus argenteus]
MGKPEEEGKKKVLTTRNKPEDAAEVKVSSKKQTKENKPAMSGTSLMKPTLRFVSPKKSRILKLLVMRANHRPTVPKSQPPNNFRKKLILHAQTLGLLHQSAKSQCPNLGVEQVTKTENVSQNRKVTDYYPIRRSSRKTKAELKSEEHSHLDDLIKNGVEEGMQVKHIEGKGRGVFAVRGFKKGEFVVEYHGDLLQITEAKKREAKYSEDPQTGCYMYYFQYQCKTYCVDATKETDRLGRLINHSKNGNCQTKLHDMDGTPHLFFEASRDIEAEEELLYDYGDRSKTAISAHPWLKY